MARIQKCTKCLREYSTMYCTNCWVEETKQEVIKQEPKVIKSKPVKKEVTINHSNWDLINWLPLYTASYLNNKKHINLNSIKNEIVCIKYWDKYILHSDIIDQFKLSLEKR